LNCGEKPTLEGSKKHVLPKSNAEKGKKVTRRGAGVEAKKETY